MDAAFHQTFKLHLPGLLKVLAEHLYTNKNVAIRELIQNAHDSCTRRMLLEKGQSYRPRIDLAIDRARNILIIADNGVGLTAAEIDDYLATIGRSSTREIKEQLALLQPDDAAKLIGQFGFGFLSAFLIASEVTVITRSIQPGSAGLRWRSSGNETYTVEPATRHDAGTTIELAIKPAAAFVLQHQLLVEIIRKYADFLPIPIHLGFDPVPINLMRPPWQEADQRTALFQYIQRTFHLDDSLWVIPLKPHTVSLDNDHVVLPLEGFLFVPPATTVSVHEYGDLAVYIRGMFICEGERDLLPSWARFVRGVIDCPALQPTASREGLHQDEIFVLIRQALAEQLGSAIRQVARQTPDTWKLIVHSHVDLIRGWAVKEDRFFELVADLVPFQTTRGRLALPEYLQLTGDHLYYVTQKLGSLQEKLVAEGHDVPVIDASTFSVLPFLEMYAQRHPGLRLVPLDDQAGQLLRPVSEHAFRHLLEWYRRQGIRAQVAAFKPQEIPAMMRYPANADFVLDTEHALASGTLSGPLAALVGTYIQNLDITAEELKGTLYLNASCPFIQQLAGLPDDTVQVPAMLTILYHVARLFAGRALSLADATGAFQATTDALKELLG